MRLSYIQYIQCIQYFYLLLLRFRVFISIDSQLSKTYEFEGKFEITKFIFFLFRTFSIFFSLKEKKNFSSVQGVDPLKGGGAFPFTDMSATIFLPSSRSLCVSWYLFKNYRNIKETQELQDRQNTSQPLMSSSFLNIKYV